jgi:hypothetical protein
MLMLLIAINHHETLNLMKYTYLTTALILFQFVNCSAQTLRPSNWYEEELKWQRNWINTFFSEYYHYLLYPTKNRV